MRLQQWLLAGCLTLSSVSPALAESSAKSDAFLGSAQRQPLALSVEALRARSLLVEHTEERLGVPTFLRVTGSGASQLSAQRVGSTPAAAARGYLTDLADVYRLSPSDVSSAVLREVHQPARGPRIVRFGQSVQGVEVFRSELKVVMTQNQELSAVSGYLAPSTHLSQAKSQSLTSAFRISAEAALAKAFSAALSASIAPSALTKKSDGNGYALYAANSGALPGGWVSTDAARARKVYFTLADRLEPAWYTEVNVGHASANDSHSYSYVISARDGSVLFRNNLEAKDAYEFRVWADPSSYLPYSGPQGPGASPHPTGTADHYQAPLTAPNLITLQNLPFSKNDPWLPPNATQTSGNNVEAYADLVAPDGYQAGVDLRGQASGAGAFDFSYDFNAEPSASVNQRKAAIANLFYTVNFLHDWFYDFGFDEAAGNAQLLNYGRGGLEGDSIRAEAQDYGGRNNANMQTPADGARPRMQMFVFDAPPELMVNSPAPIAGVQETGAASFGPKQFTATGFLQAPPTTGNKNEGCNASDFDASFSGKVALVDRGTCDFNVKTANAQAVGAIAVIIANNAQNQPAPGLGGSNPAVTIPTLSITLEAGNAIKTTLASSPVNVTLHSMPARDAALDADIVAHEWGHYISNRLVGNANGLTGNQARGMGEGWGDFHAMLLKVRDEDRNRPGNNMFQGIYAVAAYVSSGGKNNGYYFGMRRVPYSTDMTKNALTLKHIANGVPLPTTHLVAFGNTGVNNAEVHNTGEVWATMLWECYASLLNAYPFQEAQNRMKSYLVAGYKATPINPTLLEARDALLASAAASDPADYQRFVSAFAKRGAGFGAKVPDRDSSDQLGVVESYVNGNNMEVVSWRLDDSAIGCDLDGVLDLGETGLLTVTVRNTGAGSLSAFTGTVSSTGASTLQFPNGNTLSFGAMERGATQSRSIRVALTGAGPAPHSAALSVAFDEPSLPAAAKTLAISTDVNYDSAANQSLTETFDAPELSWSAGQSLPRAGWRVVTESPPNRYLHAEDVPVPAEGFYTTPWMTLNASGTATMTFRARWSFETTVGAAPYYDGAVIELSDDGVNWYDLFADAGINPGYTAYLEEGENPLSGRPAFVGTNPAFPGWTTKTVNIPTALNGMTWKFRFRTGSDTAVGAYGMDIDDVKFTNVSVQPFASRVPGNPVCGTRPVAIVSGPSVVAEGTLDAQGNLTRNTVTLDGTGSVSNGGALSYAWTQLSGPPTTLTGANTATVSFTPDVRLDTIFSFRLVVTANGISSAPQVFDVRVNNTNRPPVAVISGPTQGTEGSTVNLSGSGSSDPDGDLLKYQWEQVSGPAAQLSNETTSQLMFDAPDVSADEQLTFSLTVTDEWGASKTTTAAFTVKDVDQAPVAQAGMDKDVDSGAMVTLLGSGSDPDGDALSYAWTQVSGPSVTLSSAGPAATQFTAPAVTASAPEALVFRLTVTAKGVSSQDEVTVRVHRLNRKPVVAGMNEVTENERVRLTLSATGSDVDGDALSYAWTQTGGPAVTLENASTAMVSFTTPEVLSETVLNFRLLVTDATNSVSEPFDVRVRVLNVNRLPVAAVVATPTSAQAGNSVRLDASGSSDEDGGPLQFAWIQTGGPEVTLENASNAVAGFVAPKLDEAAELTFVVSVTDGSGAKADASVVVNVAAAEKPASSSGCSSVGGGQLSLLALGSLMVLASRRRERGGKA